MKGTEKMHLWGWDSLYYGQSRKKSSQWKRLKGHWVSKKVLEDLGSSVWNGV